MIYSSVDTNRDLFVIRNCLIKFYTDTQYVIIDQSMKFLYFLYIYLMF